MKIENFVMGTIGIAFSSFSKMVRTNLDDLSKQQILKNGLYHITSTEQVSEAILHSQYLKPSSAMVAYGIPAVFLFNGTPSVESYMKNVCDAHNSINPYLNPKMVLTAIKISPTKKSELEHYKVRPLSDNAILYEGYCSLPEDETKAVYLVPDLVRSSETGRPKIDSKTQKYQICFREASLEELESDHKTYQAKEDYLQFMEKEAKSLGYIKGKNFLTNLFNSLHSVAHISEIEGRMTVKHTLFHLPQIIRKK